MTINISKNWLVFLLIAIILIGLPRFNRLDHFGIDTFSTEGKAASVALADARHYSNHVLYFRGEVDESALKEPWVYRPLPAYVASLLPFSAMTSLNIVNYASLILGLFSLLGILGLLNVSATASLLGGIFYTFSFPNFYYATIGYIDPVLVGLMTLSLYLLMSGRTALFILTFLAGALVKETFIIIMPAWFIYLWKIQRISWLRSAGYCIAIGGIFVLLMISVRILTPVPSGFIWAPKSEMINFNLFRYRSWLAFALTLGPAGLIALYYLLKQNVKLWYRPQELLLALGFIAALAVFVFSMLSAYADGRYFWIAYPFMIPLACIAIDRYLMKTRQRY